MYRVVIVEDSKLLRVGMIHTLDWQSLDCQVVGSAGDGLEGLQIIRDTNPDIVMTDIRMPGLSGLEMMEAAIGSGCRAALIIVSGYDDFSYAQCAVKLGAVEYLVKPLCDEDIYRAVRSAHAKVDARRQMEALQQRLSTVEGSKMEIFKTYLDVGEGIKSEYTKRAVEWIGRHFAEDIGVQSVADALSISESHLSKVFKETLNTTVGEYLTNYRIREACRLLRVPGSRVYEVAASCGYNDQRHFSVIFKRIMGMTPNEFRAHSTGI